MRKLWLVLKREYLTRVKTKAFIFSTVALPLFTIGLFAFQFYTASRQTDHTLKIVIVDEAGGLGGSVIQGLDGKLPNGQPTFNVVETLERPSAHEEDALRDRVQKGQLDGFLVLPADVTQGEASAEFHTKNTGEIMLVDPLETAVSNAVVAERLERQGVKVPDVRQLVKGVGFKVIKVSAQGEIEEKGQTFYTALVVGMVLYTMLLVYGIATMRSVMEEKTTRVIEILVASVRPFYLLAGKILGVAAVGLTQYLIWAAVGGAIAGYGAAMASALMPGTSVPPLHLPLSLVVYMIVFFLCGYLLYASIYAGIGAMVSNDQEAQQTQMPVTLLIVMSFVLFGVITRDPNSPLSAGLSMIPFFAPILMILRIALQTPPFWQIALSIVISLATTIGVVYFAARIYRVGVLMYGKRPSLVELARWLRYT